MSDDIEVNDVNEEAEEQMEEQRKQRKSREEIEEEIKAVANKWSFLNNQVMMAIGSNDKAKAMGHQMMATALVIALSEIVSDELGIEIASGDES